MELDSRLYIYISMPLIAALIGWFTNYLAVKMIFRPRKQIKFLGLKLHGLIPRRQRDLAESIGETVESELVSHEDINEIMTRPEVQQSLRALFEKKINEFLGSLMSSNPMLGMFLQGDMLENIKQALLAQLDSSIPEIMESLLSKVESELNFKDLVRDKVEQFDVIKLEEIVYKISAKELKAIEVLGAVLGFFVGLVQVGVLLLHDSGVL